jgi:DNA topoisomerase-6 subunit B
VKKDSKSKGPKLVKSTPPAPKENGKTQAAAPAPAPATGMRVTAEELAKKQREISVSEFFTKNRHLLGFDNPSRALLTAVKEAVDNSLDACEEAGILPEIDIEIKELSEDRFLLKVGDNGPGIVKQQVPRVFGKLLYGSKFHTMKQARGQQGIGISAVCLYSQLTTGKPMKITSRIGENKPAHCMEIMIDSNKNEPIVSNEKDVDWKRPHGTMVEVELEGRYQKGDKSVDEYVTQTALANPHVKIVYLPPGQEAQKIVHDRVSKEFPKEAKAIKPHPYGVELGQLMKILQSSNGRNLIGCLKNEFSRVSDKIATEICANSGIDGKKKPGELTPQEYDALHKGILKTKIMSPPTDCISPIGESQILKALQARVKAQFYTAVTRPPAVYRGNPFQIEIGIAFDIEGYPLDETMKLARFANRVPLLYQPGACAITQSVEEVDWKNYGLNQSKEQLPVAPMLLMVHMASVWVPFTSEAKEAVAHYPEIIKEIKLAAQECGRQLSIYVNRKKRAAYEAHRRSIFEKYIEEVSTSLNEITGTNREKVKKQLLGMAKAFTKQMEQEDKANQESEGKEKKS